MLARRTATTVGACASRRCAAARISGGYHDYAIATGGLARVPAPRRGEPRASFRTTPVARLVRQSPSSTRCSAAGSRAARARSSRARRAAANRRSSRRSRSAPRARGERAVIYLFDENPNTFVDAQRSRSASTCAPHIASREARARSRSIPPRCHPGEFVDTVREAVEKTARASSSIDSLNGYINAMPEEKFLQVLLHELLTYLAQRGVLTFLVTPQHGFVGPLESRFDVIVPRRHRHPHALLRGDGRGAQRDLDHEAAQRGATRRRSASSDRRRRAHRRRAAHRVSRRARRHARVRPAKPASLFAGEYDDARGAERVLVVAPYGRDAEVTVAMLRAARLRRARRAPTCASRVRPRIEAAKRARSSSPRRRSRRRRSSTRSPRCLDAQPTWSDFPLVVLAAERARARHERRAAAARPSRIQRHDPRAARRGSYARRRRRGRAARAPPAVPGAIAPRSRSEASEPREGRVSRDARPRAPKPARADHRRRSSSCSCRGDELRARARRRRAPGRSPRAPRRRSARRLAHHAQARSS